jgi:hypothetical protein
MPSRRHGPNKSLAPLFISVDYRRLQEQMGMLYRCESPSKSHASLDVSVLYWRI